MSDLENRNAAALMHNIRAMNKKLDDVLGKLVLQDQKIATLTSEVSNNKQQVVLLSVKLQRLETGNGGTCLQ